MSKFPRQQAKDPDVDTWYSIEWGAEIVQPREGDRDYASGALVAPRVPTGFYYEATTAGRSARMPPTYWPKVAGATVADGTVVWTARTPAQASESTISASVWTIPAALTEEATDISGTRTAVQLGGGVDGIDYDVTNRITLSDGRIFEQSLTIPVRAT